MEMDVHEELLNGTHLIFRLTKNDCFLLAFISQTVSQRTGSSH